MAPRQLAGKGRRACNCVSGIWIPPPLPCGSQSTELSDFCQSAQSGNKLESKETLKNTCQGNDIITNVISPNQHLASTFSIQILNSRDVVASSPSLSCPDARAPCRACSQAKKILWYHPRHLKSGVHHPPPPPQGCTPAVAEGSPKSNYLTKICEI